MQHAIARCLLTLAFAGLSARAADAPSFTHKSPAGVEFTVTPDGLSSIRHGTRTIATGGWRADNGEWFLAVGTNKIDAKEILKKELQTTAPNAVQVRHTHNHIVATFLYTFAEEDVTIQARVENTHPAETLGVTRFHGLTFDFGRPPTGQMPTWHASYLRHHGPGICYPSFNVRIGATYGTGEGIGVALCPFGPTLGRSLFWWDYTNWAEGQREKLPTRRVSYLVPQPIPPLGARTVTIVLRVSPKTDWRYLLTPYRAHLMGTLGEARYKADHRLFTQCCANKAVRYITPANPYGFHDGARRLDLAEGIDAFCKWQIPGLQKTRGQGVLFWGQGGENPRGAMYRPDFDILPPEVEANWPALVARFKKAGLRIGACARPGEIAYRVDWKRDGTLRINPHDPAHVAMMCRRFKNMTDKGCTAFYLDTFGSSLDDVEAMRAYREKLGPDVQTFVEHACDAILPFSGIYTEVHFDKKARRYGLAWMDVRTWETFRFLVPGVQCVVKSRVNPKDVPEGFETPHHFLFRNHMTPLVDDHLLAGHAEELKALADEYLDGRGQWKK